MSDNESLMAMQALLKIRSDNIIESRNVPPVKPKVPSPIVPRPTAHLTKPRHLLPLPVVSNQPSFVMAQILQTVPVMGQQVATGHPTLSALPTSVSASPVTTTETARGASIRRDQIEAALRSKPQRGKKRDNLSVKERLELTRTRNREHAKSTRIRKKARYQELVDKEAQFDFLQEASNLVTARVDTMANFLACREKMLRGSQGIEDTVQALSATVQELTSFAFDSSTLKSEGPNDIGKMDRFDEAVRSRATTKFGSADGLTYGINGGNNSVAISNSGLAMLQVNLMHNGSIVKTAFIKAQFASNSHKLTSFHWTTLTDKLDQAVLPPPPPPAPVVNDPPRLIAFQRCFPSVVSFDPSHVVAVEIEKARSTAEEQGPGMNI